MRSLSWAIMKSRAIVRKGPSTVRNIIFAKLGYWPVSRIDNCDLQHIPTYCISLDRAKKRRLLIRSQVERLGLTRFRFVNAIDANNLSMESLLEEGIYDIESSRMYHTSGLTLNEIACSLSHGAAYSEIVKRADPVALILEDDALFVHRRMRAFRFEDLPGDFEVVFLNAFRSEEPPRGVIRGMVYDVTSYEGSAAAYLVTQAGARKLLAAHLPVMHAADGLLGRCMEIASGERHPFKQVGVREVLKSYMVFPDCVLNGSTVYYHVSDVQGGSDVVSR